MTHDTPPYSIRQRLGLWTGFILFLIMMIIPVPSGMPLQAQRTAAVTFLMIVWWISEALPIPVTALVPLALFPILGILDAVHAATPYADHNIFLFLGGFCIALSMEKWNLHRRIALHIVALVGNRPRQLILGFMVSTAVISMWVSNSATAMMMMPIGLAIISQFSPTKGASPLGAALMLAIAYGASIGGMGTLIGTPPNLVFAGQLNLLFPDAPPFGFLPWMAIALPFVALFLPVGWLYLAYIVFKPQSGQTGSRDIIRKELAGLGPLNRGERITLIVFVITCFAWIGRQDVRIGDTIIPGWTGLLESAKFVQDSTVAMMAALALFMLPVDFRKREFVLDWPTATKLPWGILLLFGGGFALAEAFVSSGLAAWIGSQFLQFTDVPIVGMIFGTCVVTMAITEVTSNTATATMLLPVLASAAVSLGLHPYALMIPATLSASCAFMLPVSTPPNAIVFGSGQLTIPVMAKTGLIMNAVAAIMITALMYGVVAPVLNINLGVAPSWAR